MKQGRKIIAFLLSIMMVLQIGADVASAALIAPAPAGNTLFITTELEEVFVDTEVDLWEDVKLSDSEENDLTASGEITQISPDTYTETEVMNNEGDSEEEKTEKRYTFEEAGNYEITYTVWRDDVELTGIRSLTVTDHTVQESEGAQSVDPEEAEDGTSDMEDAVTDSEEKTEEPEENEEGFTADTSAENEVLGVFSDSGIETFSAAQGRASGSFHVHVDSAKNPEIGNPEKTGTIDVFRVNTGKPEWDTWYHMGYAVRWLDTPVAGETRYAYCFEVGKGSSNDSNYGTSGSKWESSSLYSALAYAMAHGAQIWQQGCEDSKYNTGEWPLDYALTQLVAHALIADKELNPRESGQHGWDNEVFFTMDDVKVADAPAYYRITDPTQPYSVAQAQDALNKAKKLFNDAKEYGKWANNGYLDKIEFKVDQVKELTLNGNNYEGTFKVTPKVTTKDGTTQDHASKFDKDSLKFVLSGAPSGSEIETVDADNGIYKLVVPKSATTPGKTYNIKINVTGQFDREKVVNYECDNDKYQSMGFWETLQEPVEDDVAFTVTVSNKITLNIEKKWKNTSEAYKPDRIYVSLYRRIQGGKDEKVPNSDKTVYASDNWTLPANNLWVVAKEDANGNEYIYTVKENVPDGFKFLGSTEVKGQNGTIEITNEQPKIALGVKKNWKNANGSSTGSDWPTVYVSLHRKTKNGASEHVNTVTLDKNNNWNKENNWKNLPVYDKEGNVYTYYLDEQVPNGYKKTSADEINAETVYKTQGGNQNVEVTLEITNQKTEGKPAQYQLKKVSSENKNTGLAGAEFILSAIQGGTGETFRTDSSGLVTFTNLEEGKTYYIRESKAPAGYKTPANGYIKIKVTNGKVTVLSDTYGGLFDDVSSTHKLSNEPEGKKGKLTVYKTDESGTALPGAKFKMSKNLGASIIEPDAGTQGKSVITFSNLEAGEYVLWESASPGGYKLPDGEVTFTVDKNGKITMNRNGYQGLGTFDGTSYTYTMKNVEDDDEPEPQKAEFKVEKVTKTESGNTVPLAGAEFGLMNMTTREPVSGWSYTNDGVRNGTRYTDLEDGMYELREISAPEDYVKIDGSFKFLVQNGKIVRTENNFGSYGSWDGYALTFTLINEKPEEPTKEYTFRKSSTANLNVNLAGAEFDLRENDVNGRVVDQAISTDGTVTFKNLAVGSTYCIVETKAPDGYVLPDGDNRWFKITVYDDEVMPVGIGNNFVPGENGELDTFTNEPTGSSEPAELKVKKVDEKGRPLPGAEFILLDTDTGEKIKPEISENGTVFTYKNLQPGHDYAFDEEEAPDGYYRPKGHVGFHVDENGTVTISDQGSEYEDRCTWDGTTYTYTLKNTRIGDLTVLKQDADGKEIRMTASPFVLKSTSGTTINGILCEADGEVKTEGSGTAVRFQNIPDGTYTLTETKAPTGYQTPSGKATFTVTGGKITNWKNEGDFEELGTFSPKGNAYTYTMKNESLKAKVTVTKKIVGKDETLSKVRFSLTLPDGKVVTKETGTDGTVTFDSLAEGDYVLKEASALSGYELLKGKITFHVTDEGKITKVQGTEDYSDETYFTYTVSGDKMSGAFTVNNRPVTADFTLKKTAMGGSAIKGAHFGLWNSKTDMEKGRDPIQTKDSKYDGRLTFEKLVPGTYYIKETKPASGYGLPADGYITFEVTAEGKIKNVSGVGAYEELIGEATSSENVLLKNKKVVDIQFRKEDADHKAALTGAQFKLYQVNENGEATGKEQYSKEEGEGIYSFQALEAGMTYRIKETKAPDGYGLPTDNPNDYIEIVIAEDGGVTVGASGYYDSFVTPVYDEGEIKFIVKNEAVKGSFTLQKTASDKAEGENLLAGIQFELSGDKANEPAFTPVTSATNEQGLVTFQGLRPGKYILVEKTDSAEAAGYQGLTDGNITFTVDESGKVTDITATGDYAKYGKEPAAGEKADYQFTLENNPKAAEIKIKKVDAKSVKTGLEGAYFRLFDSKGNRITSDTTDEDGFVVFKNLEYETHYEIEEYRPPKGYEEPGNADRIRIYVDAQGKITVADYSAGGEKVDGCLTSSGGSFIFTWRNTGKPEAEIILKKQDVTGKGLKGAVFTLRNVDTKEEKEYTVEDESGLLKITGLVLNGTYQLSETKPPEGYEKNWQSNDYVSIRVVKSGSGVVAKLSIIGNTEGLFEINKDKANEIDVYVTNHKKTTWLDIIKEDATYDTTKLKGAEFALQVKRYGAEAGAQDEYITVDTQTSDSFGKVSFKLEYDTTYYIQETKAPAGYGKVEGRLKVTVDDQGKMTFDYTDIKFPVRCEVETGSGTVKFHWPDEKLKDPEIKLKKKSDDGKTLEGAVFELKNMTDDKLVSDSLKTGSDGFVELPKLEEGKTYRLTETKAPDGYMKLEDGYIEIKVTGESQVTESGAKVRLIEVTSTYPEEMVTVTWDKDGNILLDVCNQSMQELPDAGGPGTLPYTLSGLAVLSMAAAFKYKKEKGKRRRRAN